MGKGIVKLGEGQWAVKDGNLLAVKESNSRFLNTEFTVTRGTRATYIGRDGLIKESNLQDTNLVLNGDFSEIGIDEVTSGGFPLPNTTWTLGGAASITVDGLKIDNTVITGNAYAFQGISGASSGKSYVLTYDVIATNGKNLRLDQATAYTLDTSTTGTNRKFYFNWDRPNVYLNIKRIYADTNVTIDNVILQEVDPNDYWDYPSNWTIQDGKITSDGSQSGNVSLKQLNTTNNLITGKVYKVEYTISEWTAGVINPHLRGTAIGNVSGNGPQVAYGTAGAGSDGLNLYAGTTFSGSISNISVQEVKTATPRIDFTNNTDGHLLLEPERTNTVTYSEDFTDSSWTKSLLTATTNVTTSPNGVINADLIESTTTSSSYVSAAYPTLTATNTYTFSVFAKKGNNDWIRMAHISSGVNASWFDLENGVVGTVNGISATIEDYGNGWYRCTTTFVAYATSGNLAFIGICDGDNSTNAGASGQNDYIWGAQLEEGSYATSYIPTSGSTVTRAADTCADAGTSQDFNSTEGVLVVEMAALANDGVFRIISLSDGGTTNRVSLIYNTSSNSIRVMVVSTSTVFDTSNSVTSTLDFHKIAIKWKLNDFAVWIDGVEVATDTSGATPIGLDRIVFDVGDGSLFPFFGKVKQLQVYKEALNGTRLTHLTGTLGTDFYESYAEMASALTYTIQ